MLGGMKRHDVTQIPVEQVKAGFTLLMASTEGKPPWAIQVDNVALNYKADETPTVTITSSPHVDTGGPVILKELPFGTIVTKVVRTYDDGT